MRKYLIGAAVLVAALITAALAFGVTTRTYVQTFAAGKPPAKNTTKPGKITGSYFKERSEDPANTAENHVPKQDAYVDDIFPKGTVLNQAIPASCKATDDELQQQGDTACPKKSKVGSGNAVLRLNRNGPGDLSAPVTAFNCQKSCGKSSQFPSTPTKNQLILYINTIGANQTILRGQLKGKPGKQRLHVPVPVNCTLGTPPTCQGNADVRIVEFELTINKVSRKVKKNKNSSKKVRKGFVTTPKSCPASGNWVFTILFHGRDGQDQSKTSNSPCTK